MQETREMQLQSLDWEDPLEKEMATSSSILAWEIPWIEVPGGLQSMGCKEAITTDAREHRNNRKDSPALSISSGLEKSFSSLLLNFFICKKRAMLYAEYIITSDKSLRSNSILYTHKQMQF